MRVKRWEGLWWEGLLRELCSPLTSQYSNYLMWASVLGFPSEKAAPLLTYAPADLISCTSCCAALCFLKRTALL